jgi:hypothetical protein
MESPDAPTYRRLRAQLESGWLGEMKDVLGMTTTELPVIWDADFLFAPSAPDGEDHYVLCEINISAVWPFPQAASNRIAEVTMAQVRR